ncbi:MAG: HEAT repeat domain-containing protein [Syntrophaceae bacterium]|nr:HEAT repeat domain-containing protein [Syntrophaceae bacterium]
MADIDSQLKAMDALVRIHAAMKNAQPANLTITNSIEMLYLNLLETVRQDAPLVFAELGEKALSHENILNQQKDETINVSPLLDILLGLGAKSISFDEDLEKEELNVFIKLPAKKPKPVTDEAAMPKEEDKTAKVEPVDIEQVTLVKEQEIVSEPAVAEDQISESIAQLEKVFKRMNAMEGAISAIPSAEKMDMIKNLPLQVAEWIEKEENCTPEYKELCQRLEILLYNFISYDFFAEATPVINVFSKINNGTLKKDDNVRKVSLKVLQNLASDKNFNILYKEIITNDKNKNSEACQLLARFGNIVINKLLDGLRKSNDSKERISIIHIIEEMGPVVIPAIKASINMNATWYYLRNMAYILGRIGDESSADLLQPLLLHKEKRVSVEAFKSIGQTGGHKKGHLLLSVLPQVADRELLLNIIEMLGKIKCIEAVTALQSMLKGKTSMGKDEHTSMQQKICSALGTIGSPEAVKTLSEVVESKSILGIGSYPKEVKYAAERALAYIKKIGL